MLETVFFRSSRFMVGGLSVRKGDGNGGNGVKVQILSHDVLDFGDLKSNPIGVGITRVGIQGPLSAWWVRQNSDLL